MERGHSSGTSLWGQRNWSDPFIPNRGFPTPSAPAGRSLPVGKITIAGRSALREEIEDMKKRTAASGPLTADELMFIQKLIDDEWPLRQIRYTYGVSNKLMIRHFPEYRGMDFRTAGSIGRAIGRTRLLEDARS